MLSKTILSNTFFALLGTASPPKTFCHNIAHYTKNIKEKSTKCSLKTTDVLLDPDGHVLI